MALDHIAAVTKFHPHIVIILILILWLNAAVVRSSYNISKPECVDKCGNISIPYPFGIGDENCFLNEDFNITCNETFNPPKASLYVSNRELLDIDLLNGQFRSNGLIDSDCYDKYGKQTTGSTSTFGRVGWSRFTFSVTHNKMVAIGCDTVAYFNGTPNYLSGCISSCNGINYVTNGSCTGFGCCQSPIPPGLRDYSIELSAKYNHSLTWGFNPCSYAFVVEENWFNFSSLDLYDNQNRTKVPVVIDWAVGGYNTCEEAKENLTGGYICGLNSDCYDLPIGNGYLSTIPLGYRCNCSYGYEGNPYLINGCQDINECDESRERLCAYGALCTNTIGNYTCACPSGYEGNPYLINGCKDIDECNKSRERMCAPEAICINTDGSYTCFCPSGYYGDGTKDGSRCTHHKWKLATIVPLGIGLGIMVVLLLAFGFWLYRRLQERKQIKLKQHYFKKNGGLLLKQKISSHDGGMEKDKIFVIEELEKATDNFNQSRIIGKGGFGTIYKGMLSDGGFGTVYKGMLSDGRIVAIKKSKLVDESQVDQFINEVAILSQVNHRHAVKLLGCCLETHVPLLVYEYISNGTLSQHLHSEGYVSSISWTDRVRIATEIAKALAYMHSEASIPIFHRDIKSSNILLDETYRAKVSDFGLSRSVPIEQTHLTTVVQGTFGYSDPEYFHSGQFTDKSDVYSFGVVLLELLTGERAVSQGKNEDQKSLVMHFISALREDRLLEILEARVVTEGDKDEVMIVAKIAKSCLQLNGKKRPLMKEVAASLERLRKFQEEPWVQPTKLQVEDFLVGETSSRCTTILEVDDYDDSTSLLVST